MRIQNHIRINKLEQAEMEPDITIGEKDKEQERSFT